MYDKSALYQCFSILTIIIGLKEKRESIAIANYFKESLKDLNADYYQLLNHCDHLKYLHNMSKRCVSTLSDSNERISKTLKRFCYSQIGDTSQKKMTKKLFNFIRTTNNVSGIGRKIHNSLRFDILSQSLWNGSVSRWDGQKWKPLKVISLELWLIFYKAEEADPKYIFQIPSYLKVIDYETTLHSKYECFGIQNEMYSSANKADFLAMISEKFKDYGFVVEIERKARF